MCLQDYNEKQIREIQIHQKHLSNMYQRDVSELEAATDWVNNKHSSKSLSEMYSENNELDS